MAKVYLETSFFSACVSTRKSNKSIGWRASINEWWQRHARYFELYVSPEVVRELAAPEFPNGTKALAMIRGLQTLKLTPEVLDFAELLVTHKVMPSPAVEGDALHVAVAAVHGMDYLLTWNVMHLANPNKRTHLAIICMQLGLTAPQIVTPDMLQESESEHSTPIGGGFRKAPRRGRRRQRPNTTIDALSRSEQSTFQMPSAGTVPAGHRLR
ncbi:MAG: type II toxin-antitoxin system VapC family toxin [Tepidisphaeraceae bacterium]